MIVSNRDERHDRAQALEPASYKFRNGSLVFPKDPEAGGTWIVMHENKNAGVLLNGAHEPHESKPPYRRSRGLILLDIIQEEFPVEGFQNISLQGIEPFTAIIWTANTLFECIWDGQEKHLLQLDHERPHIWSSVTLYNKPVRDQRKAWLKAWLISNPEPDLQEIISFHQFAGEGDVKNDLLMNRDNDLFTVSITGMQVSDDHAEMVYLDFRNGKTANFQLNFKQSLLTRS